MEVTINTVSDCDREMTVTMSQEELQPHFDKAYREAAPELEIKGFRKGKVPMPMIKKMFGAGIEYQTIEEVTNETFRKELESRSIEPIGVPTIVKMDFKPGTPLTFQVKFEVKPEFTLQDLSGVAVEKYVHSATDEEVQNEVERLQQINAAYEEAASVSGNDFVVTADMTDLDEKGAVVPGSERAGMKVNLREKQTEKEIKEALQGAAAGDVREAKFEHQHGDHSHHVHLRIAVTKVEKMTLPPADDALAQKVSNGKFQTIDEMRANIRKDLESFWTERSDRRFESDLLNQIVTLHGFSVPESLVQSVIDSYMEDVKGQQPGRQFPKGFDEKRYRESVRGSAVWQAKWLLIKERMLSDEKIEISDAEINAVAAEESAKLNIDKERLVNFYKTSENALERLKYNRLLASLKRKVKVTEVATDDYSKFAVQ